MAETDTSPAALRHHAVDLEQCSLFVDSDPLKRAMTDAAATLRALAAEKEAGAPAPDGWIPWEGGKCPVGPDVHVDVRYRDGIVDELHHPAREYDWERRAMLGDIYAYRISKGPRP